MRKSGLGLLDSQGGFRFTFFLLLSLPVDLADFLIDRFQQFLALPDLGIKGFELIDGLCFTLLCLGQNVGGRLDLALQRLPLSL